LDGGADDYVVAPIRQRELGARLRAVLRRGRWRRPRVALGPFELDPEIEKFTAFGREVALTPKEFGLMGALMNAGGRVLSPEELFASAWAGAPITPRRRRARDKRNVIRVWICALRRKIEPRPDQPEYLRSEGGGYRLQLSTVRAP
jgi:two-component system KDP operon response regulator KdpE